MKEVSPRRTRIPEAQQNSNSSASGSARNGIEPTRVYRLEDVAQLLGIGVKSVRVLIKDGKLARLHYTRSIRILGEDVLTYLRSVSHTTGGPS